MDWSNETTVEFIELLQGEPVIWDTKKKSHKNRTALNDAWVRIKNLFSVPYSIEELKKKRNSLMTAYREHLRKIKETTTSGSSPDDVYKPTWFAFELMNSFLGTVYEYQNIINTDQQGDLSTERPLSHDSDRSTLNENIQTDDTLPSKRRRCAQDLLLAKRQMDDDTLPSKRRRCAQDFLLAKKQMDEAFSLIKERSRANEKVTDETDIYVQLLAQKLKKLDEDDRLTLMNDIDNLTFQYIMNARSRTKNATISISETQIKEESLVASPKNHVPRRSSPTLTI